MSSAASTAQMTPAAIANHERSLVNLVVLFCFFPFFRYIPFIEIETQPVAALFAALGIAFHGFDSRRAPQSLVLLCAVIIAASAHSIVSERSPVILVFAQMLAYLSPALVAIYLWGRLELVSWKLVKWTGLAFITLGVAQAANLVPGPIDSLLSLAISRYDTELGGSGRGVVMFANEPDYASRQLLLLLSFVFWFWLKKQIAPRAFGFWVGAIIFAIVVLNRSITGLGLMLIFLGSYLLFRVPLLARLIMITIAVLGALILFRIVQTTDLSHLPDSMPRPLLFAASIIEGIKNNTLDFTTILLFASTRAVTDTAGMLLFLDRPLGGWGVGQGDIAVRAIVFASELMRYAPIDLSLYGTAKPTAYVICLLAEMGICGLLIFLFVAGNMIAATIRNNRQGAERAFSTACLLLSATQLMLTGPHSLALPFTLLVMAGSGINPRPVER